MNEPLLFTVQEAAKICKVSVWTFRKWIKTGKITVLQLSPRATRIRKTEINRILQKWIDPECSESCCRSEDGFNL